MALLGCCEEGLVDLKAYKVISLGEPLIRNNELGGISKNALIPLGFL
jgi:hypothetical protein